MGLLVIELSVLEVVVLAGVVVVLPVRVLATVLATGAADVKRLPICDRNDGLTAEVPGEPFVPGVAITGAVLCAAGRFTPALVSNGEAVLPK